MIFYCFLEVNELANALYISWKEKVAAHSKKAKAKPEMRKEKEKKPAKEEKKVEKAPEKPVEHQQTDVNLLDKLTQAMDKESSSRQDNVPSPEPTKKKPRTTAKVKINKSRLTGKKLLL